MNIRPTGAGPAPIDTSDATLFNYTRTSNASCTVHVPDASIEWWYPATYSHALATVTDTWGNSSRKELYTFIPQTTTFDAVSALATEDVCTYGWTTYSEWDWTAWECLPYTEKPTAGSTAVIYRTVVPPIPSGGVIAKSDLFSWDMLFDDPPLATTTILIAPNSTATESAPTPFVHFTAYEVEHGNATETVQLGSVYVQSYWQKGIERDATATGPIPGGFMDQIPQSACDVGSLKAVVTVLVLVDVYYVYRKTFVPGIVHWESSGLGWEDDSTIGILDQSLTNVQPSIMTDWGLSGTITGLVELASAKPSQRLDPVLSTKAGTGSQPDKETNLAVHNPSIGQTVGNVGTVPVVMGPSSVVVIGSQTLKPGGPAATVGGTPIVLAPSGTAIIVGGTSFPLPPHQKLGQEQTVGTLGTVPVVLKPSSVVVVGTQTLQPGGPPITIAPGTTLSLAPSAAALVVGGTTSLLQQAIDSNVQPVAVSMANRPPPVLTIGTTTIVPNAATQFFFGSGQTLTPGGTVLFDGTKVSLDSSAAFVVVGSLTQVLPVPDLASGRTELVFGGLTFTALPTSSNSHRSPGNSPSHTNRPQQQNNNEQNSQNAPGDSSSGPIFVISSQTLSPGGAPITVFGMVISLASYGSFLVIDGSTTAIATSTPVVAARVTPLPLTIGKGIFKALPGPGTTYQIGTALLTPGGQIVVAETTISLAEGATALVVNGITTTLAVQAQPVTNPPILTIGSQIFTAAPGIGTTFIIGGQTLTPGGMITVDGTTIVLSPQATELAYGSSGRSTSAALFPATTTRATTPASTSAGATEGQSGGRQMAPTSLRAGRASGMSVRLDALLIGVGFLVVSLI